MTVGRFHASRRATGIKVGLTTVYSGTTTTANRRAIQVACPIGKISTISVYHNGGTGNVILAVYANNGTSPGTRIGITPSTPINGLAGWQTVTLETSVEITESQTVWLAWVFQNNPGMRYEIGGLPRANSSQLWAGGMPTTWGAVDFANYKYSAYLTVLAI